MKISALFKRRGKVKRTLSESVVHAFVFVIFTLVAFSYLYLIFWCIHSGMRSYESLVDSPFGFGGYQLSNYIEVFEVVGSDDAGGVTFVGMIVNSMYFSFLGPFLTIFVTAQLAYVTSKYKFFGAGGVYYIVLVVITLPIYGTQSAMYKLLFNLGFLNSPLMILTSLNGFSIYYMYFYGFFKSMSWTYGEAAQLDGATHWGIYFKIMLPQSLPMFGALFMMLWIVDWNSYATALVYLPEMPTLAVGIYNFKSWTDRNGRLDLLYAACAIAMLPPMLLFILCNNTLMSNVSIGGIKE